MRMLAITSALALSLVFVSWMSGYSQQFPAPSSGLPVGSTSSDMHVMSNILGNGLQQIVIVDTRQQTMAVYQISAASPKIELKSVRKIQMDLAIEQFNAAEPLPSEMRLLSAGNR